MLEPLEHRLLMRGGIVSFEGRTLTITGTAGDDVIAYRGNHTRVTVSLNGRVQTVTARRIGLIVVWAGAGDDNVDGGAGRYPNNVLCKVWARVDGGAGDDRLYSTRGGDTLLGSTGDDVLKAGVYQNTYLDGGAGDDRLYYGTTMYGGRGNDTAVEANGNLTVVGGLERLYRDDDEFNNGQHLSPVDPADAFGNLKTENGRLVFRCPATADVPRPTLTGPTVRPDGMLEIVLGTDSDTPQIAATASFDPAQAVRRGIFLSYSPGGGFGQVVLVPSA